MKQQILQGEIQAETSEGIFLVKSVDGREVKVRLSGKQRLNCAPLQIGDLVFVAPHPVHKDRGLLLTQTDFKLNGWHGWTSKHYPKPRV